jgi:hypothetical protein
MRKVILALVLACASIGLVGLTPSKAEARWWNRGYVTSYYYPGYSYYYPSYGYYPSYTYGYYPPASTTYYYGMPSYSYGTYYYTPSYSYRYYGPAVSYYYWP